MHDGAAPRRAVELLRRVGAGLPDPAEVELEPEQVGGEFAQQVEERPAVVECAQLGPVVVEAEADVVLAQRLPGRLDARDELTRPVEPVRVDPAEREPVGAERRELGGELLGLRLDDGEGRMASERDEPRGVEPCAHLGGLVPVQLEELDAVVAELADLPQRG